MASSEEGAPPPPQEEEETLALDLDQGHKVLPLPPLLPLPDATAKAGDNAAITLELATELFNKGLKAVEEGDFVDAVDCFSRALEIRVAHYGELAPECAISYYKYGSALLYKSQEEADPLVNVPKKSPRNSEKDKSPKNVGDGEGSKACASNAKAYNASSNNEEVEEGAGDKDQEDDSEGSDGDSDGSDGEGDDLDLAWKMLDVARAIMEKNPEDTIDKVNCFAALGEVSMEREDFETSLNDYLKALSILEQLVEPDNRRIVELNFRICLVLEVWSKVEEAIPYCQKAITLCQSLLKRLNEDVKPTPLPDKDANIVNDSGIGGNEASVKGDANPPIEEDEKEVLSGILSELERKLEDLQHVLSNPKSIFSEIMKMAASKSASVDTNFSIPYSISASFSSSQMGVVNGGFDSPTLPTAALNGSGITHLGVVGRGVKRASLKPIGTEPSSKMVSLDSSSEIDGSSVSEFVGSTVQEDAASPKK